MHVGAKMLYLQPFMKFPLVFLFFLCCHLLGDGSVVDTASNSGKISHSFCNCQGNTNAFEQGGDRQHDILHNHTALPGQNDCIFFEDDYNEEEHIQKPRPSTEQVSLFFAAFISDYPCVKITNSLFLYTRQYDTATCKYLAYGILRI